MEARAGTAVARWLRLRPAGAGRLAGRELVVRVVRVGAGSFDPDGAVAVVRGGPEPVLAIGGGALVRQLAQAILGGPDELGAARPPTVAEQAVWALAVATVLAAKTEGLAVEPSRIAPAMIGPPAALVEIAVALEGTSAAGTAWLALPAAVFERPATVAPLAALARDRGGWLDAAPALAAVVIAHAAVTLGEVEALRVRDAIVVGTIGDKGEGSLRVGRGHVPVTIAGDRVTVRAPYQRGRMDETLGDDLTVELGVSAGTVSVSARKLLELAPGEVLALGKPATGAVELVLGKRVIGAGELIEVDGELAVRVLAVHPR